MRFLREALVVTLVVGLSVAATGAWAETFKIADLGTLGGTGSEAWAINASGQATGYAHTAANEPQAFLYSGGAMTGMGTFGGPTSDAESYGWALSDAGEVVGNATSSSWWPFRAFHHSGGTMEDLGTLGGSFSSALDINSAGTIVGTSNLTNLPGPPSGHRAFSYAGGTMTDLGTLGGTEGVARAINSSGVIVGSANTTGDAANRAFCYSGGTMMDLGALGGTDSTAFDVNDAGLIAGCAHTVGDAQRAALYSGGSWTSLGTLGGNSSWAYGVNMARAAVGGSFIAGDATTHAFLYTDGAMTDLNLVAGVLGTGWTLLMATDINDRGQIVGYGMNPDGVQRGFLMTPVPEPGPLSLVGAALVGLLVRRRMRKPR